MRCCGQFARWPEAGPNQRLHAAAGGGDSAPILFSIDEDIHLNTWQSVAVDWFRGLNSVLSVDRTGIYGHSRVRDRRWCNWALNHCRAPVGIGDERVVAW